MTEEAEEETEEEKPLVEEIPSEEVRETASESSGPAKIDQAEAKAAASAAAAVAAKREFEKRGETENQRRWREMHEKRAPEPKPPPPPAPEPVEVGEDVDGFMSAARFAGARTGYVFKRDDRGLGYYLDNPKPASRPNPRRHRNPRRDRRQSRRFRTLSRTRSRKTGGRPNRPWTTPTLRMRSMLTIGTRTNSTGSLDGRSSRGGITPSSTSTKRSFDHI